MLEYMYQTSPIFMQNLLCSVYGFLLNKRRYNQRYTEIEEAVFEREYWTKEKLEDFCSKRLQQMVKHAAITTGYYKKKFREMGVDPLSIKSDEDLKFLPILSKEEVQQNIEAFNSNSINSTLHRLVKTSGTSGTGLMFPFALDAEREQWAVWWRYRKRHGIDHKTWSAHFFGKSIVPVEQKKPPFWRVNVPGRQIFFSGYHLAEKNFPFYVEELNRRQPPWIQGYPSLLALLASFMEERDLSLDYQPKVVTIGSESLLTHQKDVIEKAFHTKCRQHYGMTEGVCNVSECSEGRLHIDEDFGLLELQADEGGSAKIIATGYTNFAFPLLRYDTGDVAQLESSDVSCPCGLPGRLVKSIDGRIEDYVVTPEGRRVGRLDHVFKEMVHVKEAQIYQDCASQVVFRIVQSHGYGKNDEARLITEVRKRLGKEIEIIIDYVNELERTERGKLRFVISDIRANKVLKM